MCAQSEGESRRTNRDHYGELAWMVSYYSLTIELGRMLFKFCAPITP